MEEMLENREEWMSHLKSGKVRDQRTVVGLPDSLEGPLEVGGHEFSAKTTQYYFVIFSSQGLAAK